MPELPALPIGVAANPSGVGRLLYAGDALPGGPADATRRCPSCGARVAVEAFVEVDNDVGGVHVLVESDMPFDVMLETIAAVHRCQSFEAAIERAS